MANGDVTKTASYFGRTIAHLQLVVVNLLQQLANGSSGFGQIAVFVAKTPSYLSVYMKDSPAALSHGGTTIGIGTINARKKLAERGPKPPIGTITLVHRPFLPAQFPNVADSFAPAGS
jgi:hypothetical protein